MLFTLKDVADFAYKYRRRKAFKECTYAAVGNLIIEAANENNLHIVECDGRLVGVCIMSAHYATKHLFVHNIVCVENGFRTFINEAYKRFPDYQIKGERNGKIVTFNKHNLWVDQEQPNTRAKTRKTC